MLHTWEEENGYEMPNIHNVAYCKNVTTKDDLTNSDLLFWLDKQAVFSPLQDRFCMSGSKPGLGHSPYMGSAYGLFSSKPTSKALLAASLYRKIGQMTKSRLHTISGKRFSGKRYLSKLTVEVLHVRTLDALRTRTSWPHLGSRGQRAIYATSS